MQIFNAAATREALPFDRLIPALRTMFATGCTVPQRHVHEIASAEGLQFTSLIMPAWTEGRYDGVKVINIARGNAMRGLPGLHAGYVLYDAVTGVPLALIDADQITTRRTAAESALAASYLARADASRLVVVGAGQIARLLPDAYRAVRAIERVTVWARSPDQADRLADELRRGRFAASAVRDLEGAAGEADIVACATPATAPLIRGRWLRPGTISI